METAKRNRGCYFVAVVLTIAAGLASRHFPAATPAWFGKYPGDTLWALMVFFGWAALFPQWRTLQTAILSQATCCFVEILKLYQAPWIISVRHSTLGHLVFGHVFSWQNLIAYTVGTLVGAGFHVIATTNQGP